jgi:hypothetical protein
VKAEIAYFHCGDQLRKTLAVEIGEVQSIVATINWAKSFQYSDNEPRDVLRQLNAGRDASADAASGSRRC